MVSLIGLALFGILMLMIMALISNSSEGSMERVENEIYLMNCPLPLNGARPNPTSLDIEGLTVTYDTLYDNSTDYHVTVFICRIDPITGEKTVSDEVYTATTNWFDTTTGTLFYASSVISSLGEKAVHFLTLLSFIITPANFEIMGYTLDDLSGIALGVVIGLYVISYVFIAIWIFTMVVGSLGGLKP